MMNDSSKMEAVIGYKVAKYNNLKVGDVIHTSHSASGLDTHKEGLTVCGILKESHSSFDNVVFTQIRTIWEMHDHGEGEHSHEPTVCAVLVSTENPGIAVRLVDKYDKMVITHDEENHTLQAIEPMDAVRNVLNDADDTKYIVFVLCAIILIMNIMIISIITLLNMYHSAKEISLMRLIGISMKKINLLYIIQNGIIGLISTVLAFGASRLCLFLMNDYVSSMGVVLNMGKIYPLEIIILVGVFIISVLPTAIWTAVMSHRDSVE
jgi:putative ABC transport system permease protein